MSRPSSVATRVCHTIVRRPRWTGLVSPITRVPTGAEATKLVLLSIVRGPRALPEIHNRGDGAERIGEGHDRAPVKHCRAGAQILSDGHLCHDLFGRGADEFDAQQFGKRQSRLFDPIQ